MQFLNSLIQGHKLIEFLIEGRNPYARSKLMTSDVDALRQHMTTGEALKAFVTGRIVGSGPGVWVATEKNLLIRNSLNNTVISIPYSDVGTFEALTGKYGHTVRLLVQGSKYSMYGVDADLAQALYKSLKPLVAHCAFEDVPSVSKHLHAYTDLALSVDDCLADARQRLLAT
jgi:hypothetical protein